MKIAPLMMSYNEAPILPFFLKHYEHLNEIHVLFETDSDDASYEILRAHPKVKIWPVHIIDGINDVAKVRLINTFINRLQNYDWLYVVDSDEFVFPDKKDDDANFLARQEVLGHNACVALIYQVYRHENDADLDPLKKPVPQRLHGDPDLFSREQEQNRDCNYHYIKPIIVKPCSGVQFGPGNHLILDSTRLSMSPEPFLGVHWQMADVTLALDRRMKRKARMSEHNKKFLMGFQHHQVTPEWIEKECQSRLTSPLLTVLEQNYRT